MFTHDLGKKAKDKITGNRYAIQPTELKDGKPIDSIYFDEAQIEIIDDGIKAQDVQGEKRGACSPDPSK